MSSLATVITVPGRDRQPAGVTMLDPDDAELTARLIARYAVSPDDADQLADVLGLDEVAAVVTEPLPMVAPQLRWQRARHTKGRHS